ncbi:MAG: TonB-dependent receptor [Bacteroidales bacterium]
MKRILNLAMLLLAVAPFPVLLPAQAKDKDTTIYNFNIKELSIISTPKETYQLRQLPASTSILNSAFLESSRTSSIKGISLVIPNLYIPEYGSKLTSAIYLRGVGSRYSPSPSVGLYVDNVPYIDKSAFDFEFLGIDRVEVLTGPQGTLYGRNALGGIIHLRTRSPFAHSSTVVNLGAGSFGQYKGSFVTNHKLSEKIAFSLGGFYTHKNGFFTNDFSGKKADNENSSGGRVKLGWNISQKWSAEATSHIENSDQNAYPYGVYNKATGKTANPNYNDTSSYKRLMSTNSLVITYNAKKWKMNLISAYQYLNDTMKLDQDFSPLSLYTMKQAQKIHNYSQEAVFKSENNKNYQFVSGVSAFFQKNLTDAPIVFGTDGVNRFFQQMFNKLYAGGQMPFLMNVTNSTIPVTGTFSQESYGFAAFHQVKLNRVFTDKLSLILGLRYEYEHQYLNYDSETSLSLSFNMPNVPRPITTLVPAIAKGTDNQSYGQFLPKISVQYKFNNRSKIFISSARGYKAGGYNIQMFSDIVQGKLMSGMLSQPSGSSTSIDADNTISYRPEYNWNNEIGFSGEIIPEKLSVNAALFYIDSRDQQVVQFAGANGLGRIARNAAKSYSAGLELNLRYKISQSLEASLSYGYTNSMFTEYTDRQNDYSGKHAPFVPENTLNFDLSYSRSFYGCIIDKFSFMAQFLGAGKIYWTEKNDVLQDFYASANIGSSINFSIFELSIYFNNITNSRYNTFYFETLGTGIAQLNYPFNFGTGLKIKI